MWEFVFLICPVTSLPFSKCDCQSFLWVEEWSSYISGYEKIPEFSLIWKMTAGPLSCLPISIWEAILWLTRLQLYRAHFSTKGFCHSCNVLIIFRGHFVCALQLVNSNEYNMQSFCPTQSLCLPLCVCVCVCVSLSFSLAVIVEPAVLFWKGWFSEIQLPDPGRK